MPGGDLRLVRRAGQRPGAAGVQHQAERGGREGGGRRDRRRADGQHAGAQGPDREHGRGPLEEGPAGRAVAAAGGRPARARVRRAAGVDDRRHAGDGLHPLRRLRVRLPVAGGRPAVHRAGRAGEGLPLRRRPARRPGPRSACATSPRTRTASTTARTASAASRSARRASRRWTRSCGCAGARRATTRSTTRTTAAATSTRSRRSSARRASSTSASCSRTASAPFRPQGALELIRALPTGLRGFARGKITPKKALFHEKLPGVENVQRIYDHAEEHHEELNLYIVGEGGETDEGAGDGRDAEVTT